jgi:REP element-mobilizing transposase RayT
MSRPENQVFYERHLPHYQLNSASIFITFRLVGSLPISILNYLAEVKRQNELLVENISDPFARKEAITKSNKILFGKWDGELDLSKGESKWLFDRNVAEVVWNSIHYRDGKEYILDACCIMPNHVHMVINPLKTGEGYQSLSEIMQSLKGYTARRANIILGRSGQFWQHESYDHVVRDAGEFKRIVDYIVDNPCRAGLPANWVYTRFGNI